MECTKCKQETSSPMFVKTWAYVMELSTPNNDKYTLDELVTYARNQMVKDLQKDIDEKKNQGEMILCEDCNINLGGQKLN